MRTHIASLLLVSTLAVAGLLGLQLYATLRLVLEQDSASDFDADTTWVEDHDHPQSLRRSAQTGAAMPVAAPAISIVPSSES